MSLRSAGNWMWIPNIELSIWRLFTVVDKKQRVIHMCVCVRCCVCVLAYVCACDWHTARETDMYVEN